MNLTQGHCIGLGEKSVHLLVRIERFNRDEGQLFGHVINGNWNLIYNVITRDMVVLCPFGDSVVPNINVLYTDPLPMSAGYDNYNEAIAYMNDHINRPRVVSWALRIKANVVSFVTRFYKRLKTSVQMFVQTWKRGSTDIKQLEIEIDDDIPF